MSVTDSKLVESFGCCLNRIKFVGTQQRDVFVSAALGFCLLVFMSPAARCSSKLASQIALLCSCEEAAFVKHTPRTRKAVLLHTSKHARNKP